MRENAEARNKKGIAIDMFKKTRELQGYSLAGDTTLLDRRGKQFSHVEGIKNR